MHLGLKLKLARVSKGLTQQDLADKINKTRPLISHIEQTGKVNYYTLRTICDVLDIDPDDIDETARIAAEPSDAIEIIALKNEIRILKQENQMLKEYISEQKQLIKALQQGKK